MTAIKPLQQRVALITGASQGLGFAIARRFLQAGASLMLCARDASLLERARQQLASECELNQEVHAMKADVSKVEHVDALIHATVDRLGICHILVNNAGVYGPKGDSVSVDWSEWLKTIEVNLLGSVLTCRALVPIFKAQQFGRIIQLSGGGATNPLPMLSAYAVSKAAIIRFCETLAEELRSTGITVNAIAPGALNTRMLDEALAAGPSKIGAAFYERLVLQKKSGGAGFERGAELALFLASAASDGITGKLISAVWDDLNTSDVFTLRRIVGKDRGFAWGSND
jgi:NAD(P)-dependent dehydrogenase (short-subunit alcohol dehydrogenase family)